MSINNKRSYTEYTVTQPTTDFAIGFDDYDEGSKDNILVTLNGVLVDTLGYAAMRKNESTVSITPAITEGTVRLTRETDIDEPFHKFTAGALFSAKSMDENFQQVRHSQQEVHDGFVFLEYNTNSIVQESKVATAQAKSATVEATASAVRAESAADTAVQAVGSLQGVVDATTTATTNANNATATANTAASQATAATTTAQDAAQAATEAKQEAAAAAANANAATVDTLAATGRANDAADVVEDLVVGKVRAQDVSTLDGSTQDVKNTEFRNELDALPFEGGILAATFVTVEEQLVGEGALSLRDFNSRTIMKVNSIAELKKVKNPSNKIVYVKDEGNFKYSSDYMNEEVLADVGGVFFVRASNELGVWIKDSGQISRATTLPVGTSYHFKTINSALTYLSKFSVLATNNAIEVTLMLESGFIMAEQVYLKNVNLGWVTIKSVDAKVMISSAAMAVDYYPLEEETIPAAFMVDQAVGATIGTAFEANNSAYPDSRGFDGMHVKGGSSVLILSDCGFSNCKRANLFVTTSSVVNAENGFFDSKRRTSYGVYAKFGGNIVVKGATVINSVRHNVRAQRDSNISAESSKTGGQKEGGSLYASSNSVISAPFCIITNAGELQTATAVYAGTNGKVDASESVINGTSGTVAKAVNGGHIDLYDTKVSGIVYQGFEATAATISAHMMRVTDSSAGSSMFLMAFRGGQIFTSGVIARGASDAVYAAEGSKIIALDCDFSNTTTNGVVCISGSTVNMPRGKLDNCGGYAANIKQDSVFNFEDGSAINCAKGGVFMYEGSSGNLKGAILTPQTAGFGISIYGGCTVNARASTGVTSPETHNTVTSDGIIYK